MNEREWDVSAEERALCVKCTGILYCNILRPKDCGALINISEFKEKDDEVSC